MPRFTRLRTATMYGGRQRSRPAGGEVDQAASAPARRCRGPVGGIGRPPAGVSAPASKVHHRPREAARHRKAAGGNRRPRLAAPRPISSWLGSMRWRFLAASVCATEIDSTKPMTEISSAGTNSAVMRSKSRPRQRQRRQRLRQPRPRSPRPCRQGRKPPDRQRG